MYTKKTQKFLNYFIDAGLKVDGIHGMRTQAAVNKAIEKLKVKFSDEGFKYDRVFNFIGVRTSMTITNKFDDWFLITSKDTLVAMPSSTKAGLPAIMKYYNKWIAGKRGFGTIVENQQIDYILVKPVRGNYWSLWSGGLGFLYQDKPIKVYRDKNLDTKIDTDIISRDDMGNGFNVHSWAGFHSDFVGNLSEGCQVIKVKYWSYLFNQLTTFCRPANRVTYTLLYWD